MTDVNRRILLKARPEGLPRESDFTLEAAPVPEPAAGQALVRTHYTSVDPYLRGIMREGPSYLGSIAPGDVIPAGSVGEVVASCHPAFRAGDYVSGLWGWQEDGLCAGEELHRVDPALAPISTALGVLGMPGLTAYFGMLDLGAPKAGETVLVSGAAGAVGSVAGQIAKIQGCRAVGVAGSDAKVRHLIEDLGFDAAFNYRTEPDPLARLRELCPAGIDVYFDNTGGPVTDAALLHINSFARIVLCGQIAQYNETSVPAGPRLLFQLIVKQARMQGFLVFQFRERYAEGIARLAAWIREGQLRYREDIIGGIENAPRAFIGLFTGENTGKRLVRCAG
jgi:NADPH-dependent curcumin reductase CurA